MDKWLFISLIQITQAVLFSVYVFAASKREAKLVKTLTLIANRQDISAARMAIWEHKAGYEVELSSINPDLH